ncbi:MAG: sigma-70 family RNA polymerase sigma factor [Nitrososphaera sp.]|nr:sigma-70 family RNA polymerase sigma factor [Nitrososphaera sp.]
MHVKSVSEQEDAHLSSSEVRDALQALSDADNLRLGKIARRYALGCPMDADDLLSETTVAALDGNRKCPRDVPLIAFLAGGMKSIAYNEKRKVGNECRAVPIDDNPDNDPVLLLPDGGLSPEEEAMAKSEANAVFELFKGDDDVTMLLMGLYDDYAPDEICGINHWDRITYNSIRKRLRRGLDKHFPAGRP